MEVETLEANNGGLKGTPGGIGKIITVASIAAGVQFGWALQLSLLTPYSQLLGVPHTWSAFIWLCGPISGLVVQPVVGYYSDRCTSRFGRRRPFIVAGASLVTIAVFLIGFAADIGKRCGDPITEGAVKPRAVAVFVVGFWILDVANNTLQGPCRAFLGDLACGDQRRMRISNAAFAFFMAVGNVLGYACGSYKNLYKAIPFTKTDACDAYCANLKTCFIISIMLLASVTALAMTIVKEKPLEKKKEAGENRDASNAVTGGNGAVSETASEEPFLKQVATAFKTLPKSMWILMLVTCLNWIGWFPFLLYDTDWMGKEVYGGEADGKGGKVKASLYDMGVRAGSIGLLVNAVVLGVTSVAVEPMVGVVGVKTLWGSVNFILAGCLAMTSWVTKAAEAARRARGDLLPPPPGVKGGALAIFSVLGVPQAITYSIPFALASIFSSSSGAGQGLSLGLLNLAIVIPQMLVSVVSGPLDAVFGGGNIPAFVLGAVAAAGSGLLALTVLPAPSEAPKSMAPGMH